VCRKFIEDYAKCYNEIAKRNKDFAMDLYQSGVRGNVTSEMIRSGIIDDFSELFKRSGEMTKIGLKKVRQDIARQFKIAPERKDILNKITLGDVVSKVAATL
jgi:hypothetical protein